MLVIFILLLNKFYLIKFLKKNVILVYLYFIIYKINFFIKILMKGKIIIIYMYVILIFIMLLYIKIWNILFLNNLGVYKN